MQRLKDLLGIVHTAAPGATADLLESGPQACVVGQIGVWGQIGAGRAGGKDFGPFFRGEAPPVFTHKVHLAVQGLAVEQNADAIAIAEPANGSAGQGLWPHMADARANSSGDDRYACYRINRLRSVFLARSPTCFCT